MFFIKLPSAFLHILEAEPQLPNQSSQRQRGNLLPSSSGRSSAGSWKPARSDRQSNVRRRRLLFRGDGVSSAAVFTMPLNSGASVGGNVLLLQEGISGLYATSGFGVIVAGKRKGLLWKEVDDVTAEVLAALSVFIWTSETGNT